MAKRTKLPYPYMVSMPEDLSDALDRICLDNAIDRSAFILRALKLLVEYHNIPDFSIPDFNIEEQEDARRHYKERRRPADDKIACSAEESAAEQLPTGWDDDDEQVLLAAEDE